MKMLAIVVLLIGSVVHAELESKEFFYHEVTSFTVSVERFQEPIYLKYKMLQENEAQRFEYKWLSPYLNFSQIDKVADYDSWVENVTSEYVNFFNITPEIFKEAKKQYNPAILDEIAGGVDSLFYAVYFEINGRRICNVVGASADKKYNNLEEAVKADKGFLILFFEEIEGEWKVQLSESGTFLDRISILPGYLDNLETGERNHFVDVRNNNKLKDFEVSGVKEINIITSPSE